MKILLIEPDTLLARTYRAALQNAGHEVAVAPTAQGGIYAADHQKPSLVVLEMQLVSHSGIEFLYEFRSYPEWQNIPVLVLSQVPPGEFQGSWQLLHDELGVRGYLYKPRTSLAKLLGAVSEFVSIKI